MKDKYFREFQERLSAELQGSVAASLRRLFQEQPSGSRTPYSLRTSVMQYASERYGSRPEYLWSNAPNYVVLRHTDSQKWYGLIMDVPNRRLLLPGDGVTDILEFRCDPAQRDRLLNTRVIIPAYHMKRGDWAAVLLDGSVDLGKICALLDESFRITGPAGEAAAQGRAADARTGRTYTDEPIRPAPGRSSKPLPAEYRKLRQMESNYPFTQSDEERLFYRQARFMAQFEDDCPYERPVFHYFPTYQRLSTSELRGYFTWRTWLRHGRMEKTSQTYAYLYIYELLNQTGGESGEASLDALMDFYTRYGALDGQIQGNLRRWIVDYAIYYDLPAERVREFTDAEFEEAVATLNQCETASDDALFAAIRRISSYRLDRSRGYKAQPQALQQAVCTVYRQLSARYEKRYGQPYSRVFVGAPVHERYFPFRSAVFYPRKQFDHYEYSLSPLQHYSCQGAVWSVRRDYDSNQRSTYLGEFVRAADRLVREAYGVKATLQPGPEGKTMVKLLTKAIEAQKKAAAPKVEFDLSKLSGIRKSADAVGQRLMTEEERYVEETPPATPAEPEQDGALPEPERRFLQLMLYGGDWRGFLAERHLMASVLAEAVNEHLYEEFADTVIAFDGDTPVLVEDYIEDLKGMIPA